MEQGQPGKRLQMDTKPSTIPNAPAIDRSPAAKMHALRNDGSDPLTPQRMSSLSEMTEEPGPSNFLLDNAATASEAEKRCLRLCRQMPSGPSIWVRTQTSSPRRPTSSAAHISRAPQARPLLLHGRSLPLPPWHPPQPVERLHVASLRRELGVRVRGISYLSSCELSPGRQLTLGIKPPQLPWGLNF